MTKSSSLSDKSFVLSPRLSGSSRPLELYHLSHDLRGPLNSILGFCELLLEGLEGPLNENQQEDIAAIYRSAQNLLRMINSLVDLSKLEADCLIFDTAEVDVGELVQKIQQFDFGTSKSDQVELTTNVPKGVPPLTGDRGRVEQMLMSLIRFAFKMVTIGQIILSAGHNEEFLTIMVSINQLVLSPERLVGLFELAVYTDSAGRSEFGLGGLELPLTRALAEAHHGRVWAESAPDFGTRLFLQLPLSQ